MSDENEKKRPELEVRVFDGKDLGVQSKSKSNGDWKDDGTGPVPRKTYDKLRRRLDAANDAIAARYRDLDAAVQENALLARKVESAEQNVAQHKEITANMQCQHQEQRVQLEAEIADRCKTERALRSEIHNLRVKLKEAGGGD